VDHIGKEDRYADEREQQLGRRTALEHRPDVGDDGGFADRRDGDLDGGVRDQRIAEDFFKQKTAYVIA
jgi:hypothetical protein